MSENKSNVMDDSKKSEELVEVAEEKVSMPDGLIKVSNRCKSCKNIFLLSSILYHITLVFPRDGTSRGTSRDKPGRVVPLSRCPGTTKNSCPGVPLSRDKGRSKCPGPNSSVPARPGTKRFNFFQKKKARFPVL